MDQWSKWTLCSINEPNPQLQTGIWTEMHGTAASKDALKQQLYFRRRLLSTLNYVELLSKLVTFQYFSIIYNVFLLCNQSESDKSNHDLPCATGREKHERGALADTCAFSSSALRRFGLAQFMCVGASWGLRQTWDPKPPLPARRAHMSVLPPYTENVKPVKSAKAGAWQWLTIPNSAEEFCMDDSGFPCSVRIYLRTRKARRARVTANLRQWDRKHQKS